MRSTQSIDVRAAPELVLRLARDVERWPLLLPHYRRVRVLRRHADGSVTAVLVALRPLVPIVGLGLPVAWRSRTWTLTDPPGLRFRHLGGATGGMEVGWRIEATATGCRVSIEHEFRRAIGVPVLGRILGPDAWPMLVDRLLTRPIAARTLATFRALAESLAEGPTSDPPQRTNPRT